MRHIYDFFMLFSLEQVCSAFMLLFAALNTLGNVPVAMNLKRKTGMLDALKVALACGAIMVVFLLTGPFLLAIFCIDDASFALAGGIVLSIVGLEMLLDATFFQVNSKNDNSFSVTPLAFPIIAGAGTMTTLMTLRIKYAVINILYAILGNLILIYLMLSHVDLIEKKLGNTAVSIIQKIMGIILMAMAIKLIRTHIFAAI